jgi:hypothetical protein
MRKILLMCAAGLALAFTAPLAASAAPALHLEAVKIAAQGIDDTASTAWHCRRWTGMCRGRPLRRVIRRRL